MTIPESQRCPDCFGTGQKVEMHPVVLGKKLAEYEACPVCKGTGRKSEIASR